MGVTMIEYFTRNHTMINSIQAIIQYSHSSPIFLTTRFLVFIDQTTTLRSILPEIRNSTVWTLRGYAALRAFSAVVSSQTLRNHLGSRTFTASVEKHSCEPDLPACVHTVHTWSQISQRFTTRGTT
jgi:hypothetical protein